MPNSTITHLFQLRRFPGAESHGKRRLFLAVDEANALQSPRCRQLKQDLEKGGFACVSPGDGQVQYRLRAHCIDWLIG